MTDPIERYLNRLDDLARQEAEEADTGGAPGMTTLLAQAWHQARLQDNRMRQMQADNERLAARVAELEEQAAKTAKWLAHLESERDYYKRQTAIGSPFSKI